MQINIDYSPPCPEVVNPKPNFGISTFPWIELSIRTQCSKNGKRCYFGAASVKKSILKNHVDFSLKFFLVRENVAAPKLYVF